MKLEGENTLLRIFLDTFQKWHHQPIFQVIVEKAHREGLAGATVLEGIEGFGQNGKLLKDSTWGLSNNKEAIVEIVDTRENVIRFLESIEPMLSDALVTLERAHVVHYKSNPRIPQ